MSHNINIESVSFTDFTIFSEITIPFSKHINIISGETGVGKTNIMKALYSYGKTMSDIQESPDPVSQDKANEMLALKLRGVFRPDERNIGRLVKRKGRGGRGRAECKIMFRNEHSFTYSFTTLATKTISTSGQRTFEQWPNFIYIPAKEIISATENFPSLYEKYHIAFEETYYDLSKLLLLPTRKGPLNATQRKLVKTLEDIIEGKVTLDGQKFYLKTQGVGNIEMGLVAEGYRKISTLLQLISNESLTENTILFWDEPEANINPRMIPALKNMLVALASLGVQVFVTTHSYFLQQELSLFAQYENKKELDISFITLFRKDGAIQYESQKLISDLEHNPIQQEFVDLYNREQEMFYDDSDPR